MFRKKDKESKPPLTYISLSFNISSMERWLENKQLIPPITTWDSTDEIIEHSITLLPQDPFLYYHNDKMQFSTDIGGYEYIDNKNVSSLEWGWNRVNFYVAITDRRIPVFYAPLPEIFFLLQNKTTSSLYLQGLDIDLQYGDQYCKQVNQSDNSGMIRFSNALARIYFTCATGGKLVQY